MKSGHSMARNIRFSLMGHILNPLWWPRIKRRQRREKYRYERAAHYLSRYHDAIISLPFEDRRDNDRSSERIFTIWFQGLHEAPKLVSVCIERLRNVYGNRVVILDSTNLREWVELPDYIWQKWEAGVITRAHFSDLCRIAMLYQHGGMWFDATDFLTSRVPEWVEKDDMFLYAAGDVVTPHSLIQSCFMRACKGHPLFGAWLHAMEEFWKEEDKVVDYFLLHYMLRYMVENNPQAAKLFAAMPSVDQDPTHILWFEHHKAPFSQELYDRDTKDAFFQKTTFKTSDAYRPKPGTVADYIVNNKIPCPK